MSLDSTPSGGTSTFAIDSVAGRTAPCYRLTSNQSGSAGVWSVVVFDDAIPSLCSLVTLSICGEWLNSTVGNSLRIWPCLVQAGNVFVEPPPPPGSGNAYTNVSSVSSWTAVTRNVIQSSRLGFLQVTVYGSGTLTLSGGVDLSTDAQIGFLVYSDGDQDVPYRTWVDNVCVQWAFSCPVAECLPCREDLLIECSSDLVTGLSGDCAKIQTVVNTLFSGGVTVSSPLSYSDSVGRQDWQYLGTESVTGGDVEIDVNLTCDAVGGGWLMNIILNYTPTGGGSATEILWLVVDLGDDFADCETTFHVDSIANHHEADCGSAGYCCPSGYADTTDLTITPL